MHQRIGVGWMTSTPEWHPHRVRVAPTACGKVTTTLAASPHPSRVDCTRCKAAQS